MNSQWSEKNLEKIKEKLKALFLSRKVEGEECRYLTEEDQKKIAAAIGDRP